MAIIGLVIRDDRPEILSLANDVIAWAENNQHEFALEAETAKFLGRSDSALSNKELVAQAEPIVTLGGDGTMIGVARHAGKNSPRLLGVNFGTLGFLTELAPEQLINTLQAALEGTAKFATRSMLKATVVRDSTEIFSYQSINDVVIQKGSRDPLVSLDVFCNEEEVMRIRADGLIFSTPTGSTAYSLAAGGAIIHRRLNVMQLTPICPHLLTSRPLVLPLDSKLEVRVPEHLGEIFVSVDGQVSCTLETGDMVKVQKAEHTVKIARSPSGSYYEILRGKLNWTIPNKSM